MARVRQLIRHEVCRISVFAIFRQRENPDLITILNANYSVSQMASQNIAILIGCKQQCASKIFNAIFFSPDVTAKCNNSNLQKDLTHRLRTRFRKTK